MAVSARIRYLVPGWRGREGPVNINSRDSRRDSTMFYDVEMHNGRMPAAIRALNLADAGLQLVPARPLVKDLHDGAALTAEYRPHVQALLCELTGASHALVLHHLTRFENPPTFEQAYARYVHCDYGPSQIEAMSRRLLVDNGVCRPGAVDQFDYAWFNSWQPADHAATRNPLAIVDARTVEADDFHEFQFSPSSDYGVGSIPFWNVRHRHWYFPSMQPDEVLLFRQYDSRTGFDNVCPHTSFDLPDTPADAPPRRSIEVRMMAVFPRS